VAVQTLTLEEIGERSLEEMLWEVARNYIQLIVRMPDGGEVVIEPKPRLEPLPELEGYVPAGWKDAVYVDDRA
jgi:hypothetical protein